VSRQVPGPQLGALAVLCCVQFMLVLDVAVVVVAPW